jgi:hypothetical protein
MRPFVSWARVGDDSCRTPASNATAGMVAFDDKLKFIPMLPKPLKQTVRNGYLIDSYPCYFATVTVLFLDCNSAQSGRAEALNAKEVPL